MWWVELYPPHTRPQKVRWSSKSPGSENVTSCGNRVVEDVISEDEVILE